MSSHLECYGCMGSGQTEHREPCRVCLGTGTMNPLRIGELKVHPAAAAFPLLPLEEHRKLMNSIWLHGQLEPSRVWPDSEGEVQLADGRNRAIACLILGFDPLKDSQTLVAETEEELVKLIFELNERRRHMTASQRAMVAANFVKLERQAAKRDGKRVEGRPRQRAAEMHDVSERTVQDATKAMEDPEVADAVRSGKMSAKKGATLVRQKQKEERQLRQQEERQEARNSGTIDLFGSVEMVTFEQLTDHSDWPQMVKALCINKHPDFDCNTVPVEHIRMSVRRQEPTTLGGVALGPVATYRCSACGQAHQVASLRDLRRWMHPDWKRNNEAYTGGLLAQVAHLVMGGIDLDPASCVEANQTIGAKRFFDILDNGLAQDWHGRIWLNPPYCDGALEQWIPLLVERYEDPKYPLHQAMLLVNHAPSSGWFKPLWRYPRCYPERRERFGGLGGGNSPRYDNCLVYFGPNTGWFTRVASHVGHIQRPVNPRLEQNLGKPLPGSEVLLQRMQDEGMTTAQGEIHVLH